MILDNIKRLCREHKTNITNLEKEVGLGFGTVSKHIRPIIDRAVYVASKIT